MQFPCYATGRISFAYSVIKAFYTNPIINKAVNLIESGKSNNNLVFPISECYGY